MIGEHTCILCACAVSPSDSRQHWLAAKARGFTDQQLALVLEQAAMGVAVFVLEEGFDALLGGMCPLHRTALDRARRVARQVLTEVRSELEETTESIRESES